MPSTDVAPLHLAVLDGHRLNDATLARLLPECRSLTAFTTDTDHGDLAARWAAIAPVADFVDGGRVAGLREAMIECAKRRIVVLSTGVPRDPKRFVAQALQGAAAMTEYDVPGVAVHVLRPQARPGTVAWLTETGELSGYGVLFAVGYAYLHGTGVELIEPSRGTEQPRTESALADALAFAESAGVPVTRHTDPSPLARVVRDPHCLVVHPVLDAPKGFNLLHPGELSNKAVASGNPAVVVDLLERFEGDVVAVFDGVHLVSGSIPAARIAAGVALGVVAAAGIGTMVATPAMAAPVSSARHEVGNNVDVNVQVPGISIVATPHAHGETTLTLHNTTGHDIVVNVVGGHGHGGSDAGGGFVTVPANEYASVTLGGGVKQWTVEPGPVQQQTVTTTQTTPEKAPDPIIVTGTVQTFTEKGPVPPDPTVETPPVVPQAVPTPVDQKVPEPMLVPPDPTVETPPVVPQAVPTPVSQKVPEPMLVPPDPTVETPPVVPQAVPTPVDQEVPEPMLVPPDPTVETPPVVPQAVPTPVDQEVPEPMLVPPDPTVETPPVVPQAVPTPVDQKVPEPMLVPPDPTVETPPVVPQAVPTPVAQKVPEPMLQPPLPQVPTTDTGVPLTTTETPTTETPTTDTPTPQTLTTDSPTTVVTESGPGGGASVAVGGMTRPTTQNLPTIADQGHPATQGSHHHASTDGPTSVATQQESPEELAHTGGNTAILAIVAGSLLAAGAGLAVASRVGQNKDVATPTES